MIYIELFVSFFKIGMFSIGGGYAAMPLIQAEIIDLHHWLSMGEFTDLLTISQMTPGPISINAATFVGNQILGIGGSLVATLGCIMPSCIIVALLAWVYQKYSNLSVLQGILSGLRPAVVALIASAGVTILLGNFFQDSIVGLDTFQWMGAILFLISFAMLRKWKMDPTKVMLIAGGISVLAQWL